MFPMSVHDPMMLKLQTPMFLLTLHDYCVCWLLYPCCRPKFVSFLTELQKSIRYQNHKNSPPVMVGLTYLNTGTTWQTSTTPSMRVWVSWHTRLHKPTQRNSRSWLRKDSTSQHRYSTGMKSCSFGNVCPSIPTWLRCRMSGFKAGMDHVTLFFCTNAKCSFWCKPMLLLRSTWPLTLRKNKHEHIPCYLEIN